MADQTQTLLPSVRTTSHPDPSRGIAADPHFNKWGMVIDNQACIGCNACVIACQSENNIAIVGKDQILRGREMHWLRIDTYFQGRPREPRPRRRRPSVYFQPIPCMQCENAPCTLVCPVEATTISAEGINEMTYNRCVGTRYCSNNCPYKVRRFNFMEWSDYETPQYMLQRNPNVTVRARGVMEKCNYCVQRINNGRIEAKRQDRPINPGEVVTACAQACPTQAITFGNLNDTRWEVTQLQTEPLRYTLLDELNTQPRTSYLARECKNPNPELAPVGEIEDRKANEGLTPRPRFRRVCKTVPRTFPDLTWLPTPSNARPTSPSLAPYGGVGGSYSDQQYQGTYADGVPTVPPVVGPGWSDRQRLGQDHVRSSSPARSPRAGCSACPIGFSGVMILNMALGLPVLARRRRSGASTCLSRGGSRSSTSSGGSASATPGRSSARSSCLLRQDWRTSINRFAEAMTIFAVACAGMFPLLHLGRPWLAYWLLPYPNTMLLWPQFRSPLAWDVFAVSTYASVSVLCSGTSV